MIPINEFLSLLDCRWKTKPEVWCLLTGKFIERVVLLNPAPECQSVAMCYHSALHDTFTILRLKVYRFNTQKSRDACSKMQCAFSWVTLWLFKYEYIRWKLVCASQAAVCFRMRYHLFRWITEWIISSTFRDSVWICQSSQLVIVASTAATQSSSSTPLIFQLFFRVLWFLISMLFHRYE